MKWNRVPLKTDRHIENPNKYKHSNRCKCSKVKYLNKHYHDFQSCLGGFFVRIVSEDVMKLRKKK